MCLLVGVVFILRMLALAAKLKDMNAEVFPPTNEFRLHQNTFLALSFMLIYTKISIKYIRCGGKDLDTLAKILCTHMLKDFLDTKCTLKMEIAKNIHQTIK